MSDQAASHSDETQEVQDALAAFGLDAPEQVEEPEVADEQEAPAIEPEQPRKIKVKVDKEDREFDVSDDKLPEYVQKAYALDKERNKRSELEKNLERAAKLAGFETADAYLANLDKIEQEAQQQKEQQWQDLRQQLREEAEYNGLDTEKLDAWLDNHPLLQEAQRAVQERQQLEQQQQHQTAEQQWQQKWQDLYAAYPELATPSEGAPEWLTPDMQARIDRGYDPKDAYELAHKDTLIQRSKKQAEQKAIKDQRLGLRSQVEGDERGETEPEVPAELSSAFSMFGLDPRSAKKYVKER